MELHCWQLEAPASPLVLSRRAVPDPGPDEVLVEVSGCGLCRTDLGYIDEGVPLRHPLPLTLGHEVAGLVARAGRQHSALEGAMVVVPSVTPCGACGLCRRGRGTACLDQRFPGYDSHGGFATHMVVPGRGLCVVDPLRCPRDRLARLAIVADAVATPLEAIDRSSLAAGDLAVFVGAGALGIFGIQLASTFGATVVAVDIDEGRLAGLAEIGADHTICSRGLAPAEVRERLRAFARGRGIPECGWKVFETSGHPAGQETAWKLLHRGSHLAVMGYTPEPVSLRLSKLMALDARVEGNWGCLPERYPEAVDLVLSGRIEVDPYIELRPMSQINEAIEDLRSGTARRRTILCPDFE